MPNKTSYDAIQGIQESLGPNLISLLAGTFSK